MTRRRARWTAAFVLCGGALVACRHHGAAATQSPVTSKNLPVAASTQSAFATTAPSAGGSYANQKFGIKLEYPSPWKAQPSTDYELLLSCPDGLSCAQITLDVPPLPPHIPGMIPVRLVKNGYIDDLKAKYPALQTCDETPTISGATAKRVTSTWTKDGIPYTDRALILIHNDRVYILRAACDKNHDAATSDAYAIFVKSLTWVK